PRADAARAAGLEVRGVMGYEGHLVGLEDRAARTDGVADSMKSLLEAHAATGGQLISAGGTGTYDINTWATEIQAGSYALMDTAYGQLGLPFRQALFVLAQVIHVSPTHAVANAGLKAFGMDHGAPSMEHGHQVLFVADEHVIFIPGGESPVKVGDLV